MAKKVITFGEIMFRLAPEGLSFRARLMHLGYIPKRRLGQMLLYPLQIMALIKFRTKPPKHELDK